ncbi:MAG: EAL domain-containing protein [Alphaproteobacteria bacterium]|nr:EAL domain-containing protein [Alphaproteobacteria bacterium]
MSDVSVPVPFRFLPVAGPALWRRLNARRLAASALPDFDAIACASTSDGIIVQTLEGIIIWANPAFARIVGLPMDRILGRNPLSFCLPKDQTPSRAQIADFRYDPANPNLQKLIVLRNRRSDGTLFWNQLSFSFHKNAQDQTFAVLVCRDVSEQIDQTRALRDTTRSLTQMASHDSLTGLANRNRFNDFISKALADADVTRHGLAVLQIDMDRFKAINDSHGHAAGDAALQHVTAAMMGKLRQTDLLARMGGDEFVAVCLGVTSDEDLLRIGQSLCDAARIPFMFGGEELTASVSIGAVVADQGDTDADLLLQKSDFALYEVKRNGRGHVAIYDSRLHAEAQRRDRLSAHLRHCIADEKLTFYFQPTVDLITGRIRGFEALARWQHPTRGLIHPAEFLPLARDMNLLKAVDLAAISAAAQLRKRLIHSGFDDIRVGINGSAHLLQDPAHVDLLPARVTRAGARTQDFVIELAERDVFGNEDRIEAHLTAISRLVGHGFSVLIDGFGAGYAGLLHVERLAVAGFKIEKALIRRLDTVPACERITAMLLTFSREKDIYAVAYGIETADQARMVRALGGTVGQGNHFARAMPAEDVIDWLRQRAARPPLAVAADLSLIAPVHVAR